MTERRFSPAQLFGFACAVYQGIGVGEAEAAVLADTLVQADLWGHQSHGVLRTVWYARRILSGAAVHGRDPVLVVDAGAVAVLDGRDGIGQCIARRAMDESVARAKAHGVGAVAVRNSGHFGTAMYFTRRAAARDCIGILTSNASPAMAPWGGRRKLIGTNPWSIAAPTGIGPPCVLDLANTVVARGKLYLADKRGAPIPDGWAIDVDGVPTNDARAGIAGTILPMAGHKGYGIATLMDVLSGVLSGSGFGDAVVGPYVPDGPSRAGHLAVALDIAAFRDVAAFKADMDRLIDTLKAAPKAQGTDEIFFPGEPEHRAEQHQRAAGIALPPDTVASLRRDTAELGLTAALAFLG